MIGGLLSGLVVGIGVVIAPAFTPTVRPLAKSLIKTGFLTYGRGRVALAEISEHAADIFAEAQAELAEARASGTAAPRRGDQA